MGGRCRRVRHPPRASRSPHDVRVWNPSLSGNPPRARRAVRVAQSHARPVAERASRSRSDRAAHDGPGHAAPHCHPRGLGRLNCAKGRHVWGFEEMSGTPATDPLVVVSCDSHIGPTLEQLRPYCPAAQLDAFDAFAADSGPRFDIWSDIRGDLYKMGDTAGAYELELDRNLQTAGHHDMDARRRDMDAD